MQGMVESLNVSVACAIILAEAQRQRQAAGLYDRCRLDAEEYRTTLFRWCQPVLSKYCDENGFEYPPLDEEGDVLQPALWYRSVRSNKKNPESGEIRGQDHLGVYSKE